MFSFWKKFFEPKRVYLDYAAATPVRPEVLKAMKPYFSDVFGNASAVHQEGVGASRAVANARNTVAKTLGIRADGVIFTSGGTESNNLALYGAVYAAAQEKAFSEIEIISTKTEHPSILRVLEHLSRMGVVVHYVSVLEDGRIDEKHFSSLLSKKTVLITFSYANSETGVVQEAKRLSRIVRKYNTEHQTRIMVHLDACQAPLWLPLQMEMLGVDMLSLDAGKCYGPKGVGVLAHRPAAKLQSVMLGGKQESGMRAGTENTPLIVGCAEALVVAQRNGEKRSVRVKQLRDYLIVQLLENIDGCVLNGSQEHRLANNVNVSIPGIDTEFAVVTLDVKGIAASTKSACSSADSSGSYVVREMTKDGDRANATIRFSLGEETTKKDIDTAAAVLAEHAAQARKFKKSLT